MTTLQDALAQQVEQKPVAVSDAMVEAYLTAQRKTVEEADRFGRPNAGGLHTNTVREACRNGISAALAAAPAPHEQPDWLLKTTQDLANCIRRRCFPDVPQFQVMGDLAGVISQIGNMTTGMERKAEPQEPHAWMIQGSHATWKGEHAEPANSYDLAKRADNGGQP